MNKMTHTAAVALLVVAGAAADAIMYSPGQVRFPIEVEANDVFRESFIAVMESEPGEWELQPRTPRGPAPRGRPPLAYERMRWLRRGNENLAFVTVTYWRYSSNEDARIAVKSHRMLISVATSDVKGFADEAFVSAGNTSTNVTFRHGTFVFAVHTRGLNTSPVPRPPGLISDLFPQQSAATVALSKAFLDAAKRVLADADVR